MRADAAPGSQRRIDRPGQRFTSGGIHLPVPPAADWPVMFPIQGRLQIIDRQLAKSALLAAGQYFIFGFIEHLQPTFRIHRKTEPGILDGRRLLLRRRHRHAVFFPLPQIKALVPARRNLLGQKRQAVTAGRLVLDKLHRHFITVGIRKDKIIHFFIHIKLNRTADRPRLKIEHQQRRAGLLSKGNSTTDGGKSLLQKTFGAGGSIINKRHPFFIIFAKQPVDGVAAAGKQVLPERLNRFLHKRPALQRRHRLGLFQH
ncbi:MAG: hypothetical protein BWY71_02088 [Planctomycetes bacterium ADurb.Bin412]|nr:MAG: hypothetical protein BWY71_02088 [Planctomycetes bacterium ADurb.Bin412]